MKINASIYKIENNAVESKLTLETADEELFEAMEKAIHRDDPEAMVKYLVKDGVMTIWVNHSRLEWNQVMRYMTQIVQGVGKFKSAKLEVTPTLITTSVELPLTIEQFRMLLDGQSLSFRN